jgi:hypothetical protein
VLGRLSRADHHVLFIVSSDHSARARQIEATLDTYAFDLLELDGEDYRPKPLAEPTVPRFLSTPANLRLVRFKRKCQAKLLWQFHCPC